MNLNSEKLFKIESKRLKKLIQNGTYSFAQTRKKLLEKTKEPNFNRNTLIESVLQDEEDIKIFSLISGLKNQAPKYLYELIFTRLISALEVFLIDSIKEIGQIYPELFMSDKKISYTRSELLQFKNINELFSKIIQEDCRRLSSGGFKEITKFYNSYLGLDYKSLDPGISTIQKYHEQRHLLVHRLGQTDEAYRHKYDTDIKNISIGKKYLNVAINELLVFAQELNIKITKEIFKIEKPELDLGKSRYLFVFHMKNKDRIPIVLSENYKFKVDNTIFELKDSIISYKIKDDRLVIILENSKEVLDKYSEEVFKVNNNEFILTFSNPKRLMKKYKHSQIK